MGVSGCARAQVHGLLGPDKSTTYVYTHNSTTNDKFLFVELSYLARGTDLPDPLLMLAFKKVPFIFYDNSQFTTNATYYDQVSGRPVPARARHCPLARAHTPPVRQAR